MHGQDTQPAGTPSIGILMLESQFPRISGDIGCASTWPFPVYFRVVRGASPDLVVRKQAEGLLPAFIDAAQELVSEGVDGITTSCGFLSLFQARLTDALPVPIITSSLMQLQMVNQTLPRSKRAGILTVSASTLTNAHLSAANVPEGTPIGSTEGGQEFTRAILENEPELNVARAREDNVEAARALQRSNPDLGAIVLECTNMGPYAADIARATRLPVFSIITLINWFQASLKPPCYGNR